MTTQLLRRNVRVLVINPNSSASMTSVMIEAIKGTNTANSVEIYAYTAPPESPASINDGNDVESSSRIVFDNLVARGTLKDYDAVLVACYSVHPLVQMLALQEQSLAVIGIFEASIVTALSLLSLPKMPDTRSWGVVTTGKFWEEHLTTGVKDFLGQDRAVPNARFAGVESTGLVAGDFHGDISPEVIQQKLKDATKRLLVKGGSVECIVMGCAGMAGLEETIRSAAIEQYGTELGRRVYIIDGVKAGIGLLEEMVKNKRMFQQSS